MPLEWESLGSFLPEGFTDGIEESILSTLQQFVFWWKLWRWQQPAMWRQTLWEQFSSVLWASLFKLWNRMWDKGLQCRECYPLPNGWGHSNLCEVAFNVLSRFHAKRLAIRCLSYITLSKWGLIMSCSPDLSPYASLFKRMGQTIFDGMEDIWTQSMEKN